MADNLHLLSLLEIITESDVEDDNDIIPDEDVQLRRMLTIKSDISTTSTQAERHHAAQQEHVEDFKKIGAGACGAVFAQEGKSVIVKLSKTNEDAPLWNDYIMHLKIQEYFRAYSVTDINIPKCHYFVPGNTHDWFSQHQSLVEAAQTVCNFPTCALISERILPLPKATRTLLIQKYCLPRIKSTALSDKANDDCLVRIYLGSMQGKATGMFFSLRNFKLHLNQMADIKLDVEQMARRMGIAFAIMHWAAETDARDIEFVLGSSTLKSSQIPTEDILNLQSPVYTGPPLALEDFFQRVTGLWLLDFNQVRSITLDEAGVDQAVEAVRINDPYLPKPLQESAIEKKVWNTFAESYIRASDMVILDKGLDRNVCALPRLFLRKLVELQRQKQKKSE